MNFSHLTDSSNIKSIFIAEAGINHDGSLEKAKLMVDSAVNAGADYVKFQTFKSQKLVTPTALTSSYIDQGSKKGESFQSLLKRLELNESAHYELKEYCQNRGIKFLSTAFDESSFDFLIKLGIDVVKIASGDLTHLPLLKHMASAKLPMILSTGMATLGEIEDALSTIVSAGNNQIILLHCISWYPADIETTQLRYMETLRSAFGFPVGYSDHTLGINMSIAARALGAVVLEKHFTLDRLGFGPDHAASIEPDEMTKLVNGIREVEKGLGNSVRNFCNKELSQRRVHRRSIVVNKKVKVGDILTTDNLTFKRPGIGIEPKYYDAILGKSVTKDLFPDELLSWGDIQL